MSRQDIFNQVVQHLRSQGQKAVTTGGQCMYRTPTGLKCAAGCLISDEDYSPEFEDHMMLPPAIKDYNVVSDYFLEKFPDLEDRQLISSLQRIHDRYSVTEWEGKFQELARHYGLTLPEKPS